MTGDAEIEFSRPLSREEIGRGRQSLELSADERERAALARRFGLLALDRLEARVTVAPQSTANLVLLKGHLSADVTQACVVTLEPVRTQLEESFSQQFSLLPSNDEAERELVIDPEGDDPPEPLAPQGLDLGEVIAQQLAVALEPYPRAEGARLDAELAGSEEGSEAEGPFADLMAFKGRT